MKMFEWINRRLHCINSYSQFPPNKYGSDAEEDDEMIAAAAEEEEETDTAALLLHDMLNEILTLGTLSRHHPLISQAYADPGDDEGDEGKLYGQGVPGAAAFFSGAREPSSAFRIKLTAEEERRIMEVAVLRASHEAERKTVELPLLEERRRPPLPRTTLEELLAATRADFLAGGETTTVHVRKAKRSAGTEKKRTNRRLQNNVTLISKRSTEKKKKKIHPEEEEEERKQGEVTPMAAHVASDNK